MSDAHRTIVVRVRDMTANAEIMGGEAVAACSPVPPDPHVGLELPRTYGERFARLRLPASVQFDDPKWWRDTGHEIDRLREALIVARAAHVLRNWDDSALFQMDSALAPNKTA